MNLATAFGELCNRPLVFGDERQIEAHRFLLAVLDCREHLRDCSLCRSTDRPCPEYRDDPDVLKAALKIVRLAPVVTMPLRDGMAERFRAG